MPTYTFTGPNGQSFSLSGDGTPQDALAAFQGYQAQQQAQTEQSLRPKLAELSRMSTDPASMERNIDIDRRAQILQQAGTAPIAAVNLGKASMIPFSDELASLMGAPRGLLPGGHGMAEEYNRQQEAEARARSEAQVLHPAAYGVGQAGGLIGTVGAPEGGLAALAAKGGVAAPATAAAATRAVPAFGEGILGQTVRGAVTGGSVGALQGAGEGDTLDERIQNAKRGLFYGGLFGAAAPAALMGGAGLVGYGRRAMQPIADWIAPDTAAAAHLERVLQREGTTPEQFAQRFEAQQRAQQAEAPQRSGLGAAQPPKPTIVPADVGGANVRGLVRAVANVPGTGREEMLTQLGERTEATGDRVLDAVRRTLRNPADFTAEGSRLTATQEHLAGPIYQQAYASAKPVDLTGVIKNIDDRLGTMSPGHVAGPEDIRPDSVNATLLRIRSALAGPSGTQRFSLRQLQNVKVDLDSMISAARIAGDKGKTAALMETKRILLQSMDRANPLYKRARNMFAGAAEAQDALEAGRNVFKMTDDEVRGATASMTQSEREMFQVGVARAIQDQVQRAPAGFGTNADVVKTMFATPRVRNALRAGFGDDQAFRRFHATMKREAKMRQTYAAATGNSTTARQMADIMDMRGAGHTGAITSLLAGHPGQAVGAVVRRVLLGEHGITEAVADRLAKLLLSNDPQYIRNAVAIMRQRRVRAETIQRLVGGAGFAGAAVAGRLQGPSSGPLPPMLPEAAGGSGS